MAEDAQKDTKISLDKDVFWGRLKNVYAAWNKGGKMWAEADACLLLYGQRNEDVNYCKTIAMELSLIGSYRVSVSEFAHGCMGRYELADSVLLFTEKVLYILTGS